MQANVRALGRGPSIACALLSCALALAACGSSDKAHASDASFSQSLKFASCMRAHGVPNFPDPTAGGGGIEIAPGSGLNPFSPSFQSAQKACKAFAPPNPGPIKLSASERRKALVFAQCMRAHGDPSFPDPMLSVQGDTPVIALRGLFFPVGAGFDPQAPAFKQAASECGLRLP